MLCNTYTQIKITKQKHSKLVTIKFALSVTVTKRKKSAHKYSSDIRVCATLIVKSVTCIDEIKSNTTCLMYFSYIFFDSIEHNGDVSPESYKKFDCLRMEVSVSVWLCIHKQTPSSPSPLLRKEFESRYTKRPYNSLAITCVFCTFNPTALQKYLKCSCV